MCVTTAALYLQLYLCLFPAVCPVYSHTAVRERHTQTAEREREREHLENITAAGALIIQAMKRGGSGGASDKVYKV